MFSSLATLTALAALPLAATHYVRPSKPDCDAMLQSAINLYTYAYPLVILNSTANSEITSDNINTFTAILQAGPGPLPVVQFNSDTAYLGGYFNLSQGNMLVTVPDHGHLSDGKTPRFWIAQTLNAWTDVIADPGSRTLPVGSGHSFALVGPHGSTKGLPSNATVIKSPTELTAIIGRIYTDGTEADVELVGQLASQWMSTPLDLKTNSPGATVPTFIVPSATMLPNITQPPDVVAEMPFMEYFSHASALLCENTPAKADLPLINNDVKKLGFSLCSRSEPFKNPEAIACCIPDNWSSLVTNHLDEMHDQIWNENRVNSWTIMPDNVGEFGTDYDFRAVVAKVVLAANKKEDALYPSATVDSTNATLSSSESYTITFPKGQLPPSRDDVGGFWSLTYYTSDSWLGHTEKFAVRSRDELVFGNDGSFTIYVQPEAPGDATLKANWLPTAPNDTEAFSITMRIYIPQDTALNGDWVPPPLLKAEASM
ncbi:hypothetical protein BKA62DRAFT_759928 [Auriculariales sp. MPI-PUGE-AT-0066]|nr:hypothetical protein BKA62DRAFT_759928 [Auriculariales sp. MPI-PUGE-AT-0066]